MVCFYMPFRLSLFVKQFSVFLCAFIFSTKRFSCCRFVFIRGEESRNHKLRSIVLVKICKPEDKRFPASLLYRQIVIIIKIIKGLGGI